MRISDWSSDVCSSDLFLDHRPLRQRIFREARGRRFLNLFCYTGAATVQAAVGGAAATTSVDLSATYLPWLSDNLRENTIDGRAIGGEAPRLVQADAVAWLAPAPGSHDLPFCHPPPLPPSPPHRTSTR